MDELTIAKRQIEALLFSSGRKMDVEEIAQLLTIEQKQIISILQELKEEYNNRDSALKIVDEGEFWKIAVREQFIGVVQSIVTETELNRALTETLAVIAFKNPALQADIIKIRGNKAYEHLAELSDMGYVTKQKEGRTYKLRLTQKFFDYFELPPQSLDKEFKDFRVLEEKIVEKEKELEEKLVEREEVRHKMEDQIREEREIEAKLDSGDLLDDEDEVEREDEEQAQEDEIKQEKENNQESTEQDSPENSKKEE